MSRSSEQLLGARIFVFFGVPLATAAISFQTVTFVALCLYGSGLDASGLELWSGVAFFVGELAILVTAIRAWRRNGSGDENAQGSLLARMVPWLMGLGLMGGLALLMYARNMYEDSLQRDAHNACLWADDPAACEARVLVCGRARPLDEPSALRARSLRECADAN